MKTDIIRYCDIQFTALHVSCSHLIGFKLVAPLVIQFSTLFTSFTGNDGYKLVEASASYKISLVSS